MDAANPVSVFGLILQGGSFAALLYFFLFLDPKRNREWQQELKTVYEKASGERAAMLDFFSAQIDKERQRADRQIKEDREDCGEKFKTLQLADADLLNMLRQTLDLVRQVQEINKQTWETVRQNAADNRTLISDLRSLIQTVATPAERRQGGGK